MDDDFNLFEDSAKGFKLIFDFVPKVSATNFPEKEAKALEDFMNANPEFWGVLAVTGSYGGLFAFIGYDMYSKENGFTDFVDGCVELYNDLTAFGFDFSKGSLTRSYNGLTSEITLVPSLSVSNCTFNSFGFKTSYSGTMKISGDFKFNVNAGINFTVNCQDIDKSKMNNFNIGFSVMFKPRQKCNVNLDLLNQKFIRGTL